MSPKPGYGAVAFDGSVRLDEKLLPRLGLSEQEIQQGIGHRSFALIDMMQPCVSFNKVNTSGWYKQRCDPLPQAYDCQQVLSLPIVNKAVTIHCVEGRKEHLLFEGVCLNQDIK